MEDNKENENPIDDMMNFSVDSLATKLDNNPDIYEGGDNLVRHQQISIEDNDCKLQTSTTTTCTGDSPASIGPALISEVSMVEDTERRDSKTSISENLVREVEDNIIQLIQEEEEKLFGNKRSEREKEEKENIGSSLEESIKEEEEDEEGEEDTLEGKQETNLVEISQSIEPNKQEEDEEIPKEEPSCCIQTDPPEQRQQQEESAKNEKLDHQEKTETNFLKGEVDTEEDHQGVEEFVDKVEDPKIEIEPQDQPHTSFQTAIGNSLLGEEIHYERVQKREFIDVEKLTEEEESKVGEENKEEAKEEKLVEQDLLEENQDFILNQDKMEFTKNYSDDLLMGQNEGIANQQGEMLGSGAADLADFELPPYSGGSSSSSSEANKQQSPVKRKSSTSSAAAKSGGINQEASVGLRGVKSLLLNSYANTSHVLQWKKPIETGIYFSIGVSLITALTFFSIISVVAYAALGIILTTGSIRLYKFLMQTLNKSTELPFDHVWNKILGLDVSLSTERLHEFIDGSLGNINSSLVYLKQVLLFEDKIASLKVGGYFYLLTYIGSWFNGMTLITITYLALFTLPIAYEKNKSQIDQYFNLVHGHVCSTSNKISSMVSGGVSSCKKRN